MLVRHLAALTLSTLISQVPAGQEPPVPEDQEPRLRIEIDVTATVPDDEHWLELKSRNFVVAGTAGEGDLRKIAADLELVRDMFAQINPRVRAGSPVPTTVLVFSNSSSVRWYRPKDDSQPSNARGYVQAGADKNYIVMREGSVPREIFRDYIRLLIPEAMGPVPLWFREGLADYFSALKVNRYLFGDHRWTRLGTGIDEYDALLDKKAKLLTFESLLGIHEDSAEYTDPVSRNLFLAQSWGVVHYLMSRPGGLASMQRVFNMLGEGEIFDNAVRQSLGRTASLFEQDFRRYIRDSQSEHQWSGSIQLLNKSASQVAKGECGKMMLVGISVPRFTQCYWDSEPDPPGVYRVPYSFDKTWAEVSPLKARELSEAEAWFYRGDLMLHIGRLGEAEAYLRRSIQQPPQVSRTHAAVGLLHLQQKRYREASESLKLALELEPNNYLAHYYHVVLTELRAFEANESVSYDDLEDMHDELLKILAITPEFADAAEMLARINGVRQTAAAESIKVLIDAIKRYPGRSSAWIALAGAAVRGGDAAGARSVLNRLLAAGATDAESRRTVATLLQAIEPGETRTLVATPVAAGTQQGAVRATSVTRPNARSATPVRGDKLSGLLTLIECKNGLTLSVKTGGKTVKLRTNSAFSVEFIARDREGRATTSDPIVCGPTREDGIEVSVTYRASRSGDSIGEPLIVEIRLED